MDKDTLQRYQRNRKEILQLREEIETLRAKLTAPGTQKITGMPTVHGGSGDPIGSGVAKLDELCALYGEKLGKLCQQQLEIETAISKVGGDDEALLRYRYIQGHKWETICTKMGKSEDEPMEWGTVHYRHRRALRRLAEIEREEISQ